MAPPLFLPGYWPVGILKPCSISLNCNLWRTGWWCNMRSQSSQWSQKQNSWTKQRGEHLSAKAVTGLWSYLTCLQRDWLWCTENSSPTATQSHCQMCSWAHRLPCRQHRCELLFILSSRCLLTVSQTLVVWRHELSCFTFNSLAALKSFSATELSFLFLLEINIAFHCVSNFIR